jgi:pilus assembly protein CpaB
VNNNETRTLWISVGSALFAVFLLYSYTQEKSAELQKKFGAKQRVVIAKEDINEMQTVDETMLTIEEKPVDFIVPGAFSDPEDAVGMIALAPIKQR